MSEETSAEAGAVTDFSGADWFRDESLQAVLALLNRDGGEARVVGGAVRNALMGLAIGDIDIATTLKPQAVMDRAAEARVKALPTGVEHGTVTLVHRGRPFEITTLRADVETDGRHAEVLFGTDWAVDAARRDLTINALYLDRHGKVIDLVDGLADIRSRTIRFIGEAELRIEEDYLRILRFFRFFAWYGSGRPDADGIRAAAKLKDGLVRLSAERVWAELKKLLSAPDPSRALLWMRQAGVLGEILPESQKWGIDAIPGLIHAEEAFGWQPDPMLRLMAMVPPDGERMEELAKRLRMSRAEARRLRQWAGRRTIPHEMGDLAFGRLLYGTELGAVRDRMRLDLNSARTRARTDTAALAEAAAYSRLLDRLETWQQPKFPITGEDLLAAGIEQGPGLGETRERLERAWVESNFTMTRDDLMKMVAAQ